jgi:capsule polysaccharide export protein KpsE/RkpR
MNTEDIKVGNLNVMTVIKILLKNKLWILLFSIFSAVFAVWFALNLPNKYTSSIKVIVAETDKTTSLASVVGGLGGLASMAGINLGGSDNKALVYSELIKSKYFLVPFIKKYDLAPKLIAVKGWNQENNTFIYDNDIYDEKTKTWTREITYPYTNPPSDWELYSQFRKVVSYDFDKKTGFLTLRANFYSPYFTQKILSDLVLEFNELRRIKDIKEASDSINYLEKKIAKNNIHELNELANKLISENMKILMLADIRNEYAFETVEPPSVNHLKSSPRRAVFCVLITLLGFILACLFPILQIIYRDNKNKLSKALA